MKQVVMMGTSRATKGGIASVVQVYDDAGLFQRFPIHYIETHRDGGALTKLRMMARAYLALLCILLRGRAALLHVHTASRASFWRKYPAFLLARLFGVPTILHLHGGGFAKFYGTECGRLRKWMIRNVYDNVTCVLVLSAQWERWVRGITRNTNVQALYNPVIAAATTVDWSRRDPATVLMLGRLNKNKGTYDLLKATAKLPPTLAHARLCLGGDGEIEQAREAAGALGLAERVELAGWIGPEAKTGYLDSATVYVLPSYNEGLPMSVLEAMAAGLPVVTTPVGGIPEAVTDGVEGFLIQPGDIDALRDRLQALLSDPALARRMGEAGRRKVEAQFLSTTIMPRLERLYVELGATPAQAAPRADALARNGAGRT
ncbi:hypothetical protein C9I28_09755 [Pseudoduganella armeniaca]|uniref:Glycosyltransferase n=2 Tax=Pseudoduganella armeniaca TaxID=2072590 RepID=A0A2R4C8S8_9BURK|nr:hypothetical protein C9I28_09755 [Pseudoduganella armeniaca]